MLSTISTIRLAKTFGNLMVDVSAGSEKLRAPVPSIVRTATGSSPDKVEQGPWSAGGDANVATVSRRADVDAHGARARLAASEGGVRRALGA
jgi:N-acetylmuramic acid 6-phosphate etherase